jgi:hypothetical protein
VLAVLAAAVAWLETRRRRLAWPLWSVAVAAPFLSRIDPELEQLQQMRARYAWVSLWISEWIGHYVFLWGVSIAALLRLRKVIPDGLRFFMAGLPLAGMLSLPVSCLLLDQWKWALMPKFQPARAVLFVSALAAVLAIVAGLRAARSKRFPEALMWGILAFAIPIQDRVSELLLPDLSDAIIRRRVAVTLVLAVLAAAVAWLETRRRRLAWPLWSVAVAAPFLFVGQVVNHTELDHPELRELSSWARVNTARDAVFLFPDAGKGRHPGLFRTRALRAVYVDWKGGGQVNMLKKFGQAWWNRWQETMAEPFDPDNLRRYKALWIDYVVVGPANRLPDREPVFDNGKYLAYRLR